MSQRTSLCWQSFWKKSDVPFRIKKKNGTKNGKKCEAAAQLEAETGIQATVINPYYITGLDTELLDKLKEDHELVLTIEDGILDGGFGEKIARYYGTSNIKVRNYGLKKEFLDRYDPNEVVKENHLTAEQIVADIKALEVFFSNVCA